MLESLKLATVSVAESDASLLKVLFEKAKSQLHHSWSFSTQSDADVLIIDIDSVYGHIDWLKAHAAGLHVITISARPSEIPESAIRRPVSYENVLAVLTHYDQVLIPRAQVITPAPVVQQLPAKHIPAMPTHTKAANEAPANVVKTEAKSAQEVVVAPVSISPPVTAAKVIVEEKAEPAPLAMELPLPEFCSIDTLPYPARLVMGDSPALTIDAQNDCYYGPATLKPLAVYCEGLIARAAWKAVSPAVMQGLIDSGTAQPLSRLLWFYTLSNSKGQLLANLDSASKFSLNRYPPSEREFPKHFRIATSLMKGGTDLKSLAEQSGAAINEVIDFINAYSVTGFVGSDGKPASDAPASNPTRSMLATLRNRLGRNA